MVHETIDDITIGVITPNEKRKVIQLTGAIVSDGIVYIPGVRLVDPLTELIYSDRTINAVNSLEICWYLHRPAEGYALSPAASMRLQEAGQAPA